jgi:hypothetical protein
MYTLKSPYVEIPNVFETLEDAYYAGQNLLKNDNAIKFLSIVQDKEIINKFVKPGYRACTYSMFKHMDEYNGIADYFILHQDGHDTYYIKSKKF